MFEQPGTERLERQETLEKLLVFIKQLAERYRTEGIPIDDDGRISMPAYKNLYRDVDRDISRSWEGRGNTEELHTEQMEHLGEKLEMLAYAIFAKNFGEGFVIARSSTYDDWSSGADTILLDRETGALVCAFDEVGDTTGEAYEKKQRLIRKRNLEGGGVHLKYGLSMAAKGDKRNVTPAAVNNVPIFYIALRSAFIDKGMSEFQSDPKAQSPFEQQLFSYFVATISQQIEGLKLYGNRLNPNLKKGLGDFESAMNRIKNGPKPQPKARAAGAA